MRFCFHREGEASLWLQSEPMPSVVLRLRPDGPFHLVDTGGLVTAWIRHLLSEWIADPKRTAAELELAECYLDGGEPCGGQ